jgi:flagellar basal-body rod protein FlgF/flagellar basal-body rod protein FlgG
MDSGYYVAYAGLAARMEALDVMAGNLANASTTGFKGQSTFYRALSAAQDGEVLTPLNQAVNDFGILGGSRPDLQSGSLLTTGGSTDLAMEGDGYFSVQTKAGIRYTRNGNFRLNASRQIVTQDGDFVLAEQGANRVPITLPTGTVFVSPDGTVSVDGGLVSKLHVVQFTSDAQLTPEGGSNFLVEGGVEKPATDANVRQGMLESSNLNPVVAAVGLIVLQRQADILTRALSIFNQDFDRTAATDLPHV